MTADPSPLVSAAEATKVHNAALQDGAVRTVVRYAAHVGARFRSDVFLRELGSRPRFPQLKVGDLLSAAHAAGLALNAGHASIDEIGGTSRPFLTYLKRGECVEAGLDLVHVAALRPRSAVVASDRFGTEKIPRASFDLRWSGIVLQMRDAEQCDLAGADELDAYRAGVEVLRDMLSGAECAELIRYCEEACFKRSKVVQRHGDAISDVVQTRVRSSSSVVLPDRSHPLLARLYAAVAAHEGVAEGDIELIQCVRYKRGQKFRAHFDGGVDLPRLATYLLYLNDDFTGGETYFPMLDLAIAPRIGSCLRFPSCTPDGRVLWQSEHGGLPVRAGVKYALNIWVRCPARRAIHRGGAA